MNQSYIKNIAGNKVKKGTCYIYAYVQSGVYRKIKVTVK